MTPPRFVDFLRDQRNQIVLRFVAEVQRKDLSPPGTSRTLLVDHIPKFLDEIVTELAPGEAVRISQDAVDVSETARRHGEQRYGLGYDLGALIREYGVLRHCILLTAREAGISVTIDEFNALAKCLNVGVAQAATEYILYRDRQFDGRSAQLEFLLEAGQLLSSSLDYRSTLSRLTGLLVPRMADWCAVHLEDQKADDMPLMHVDPAKIEVLRTLYRDYPLPEDALSGSPHVVRTGEPALVAEIPPGFLETFADSPEQLALLRAVGTASFIIVPLRVQGNVFGALTLAYSDSQRRYGEADLALASELARRAAVAIDNAKLYARSQNERSRVEAATRAKDEFVAMVSHELRTPLNAILGWLRLIREGGLPDEKRHHAVDVSLRNAQALNQLVADLLDISRVMTGKIRISPSQVDMGNVVEMAIESVRPAAQAKRIKLDAETDIRDAVMRGDGDRLQQVAWNLVANAVKFTPKDGMVKVRVRRLDSDLELTVEDSGVGIAADFLPHAFDGFRQSDSSASRGQGGLGIGLSISKHIVELHGGSITARSPGLGKGATFVVRLPISPLISTTMGISRVPATMAQTFPAFATPVPPGLDGMRILVVDDEPDARELVGYVLESAGMQVRLAGSAAEALKELESFTPHVIVSDIGMPEQDGYFLIRRVRTLTAEDKRSIPAIALTAFARNEDRKRALVEGFNLHMVKPVEPAALVRAVIDLAAQMRR